MKYILNDQYSLCGYKGLPFALYDIEKGKTHFFSKEEYSLLLDCDGITEINIKELNEDDQKIMRSFINGNLVRINDDQKLKD